MMQTDIFDFLCEDFKFNKNKPIKVIELFSGIGATAKAFEILKENGLDVDFQLHKTCEWAYPSILAYKEIHQDYLEEYNKDFAKEIYDKLGISDPKVKLETIATWLFDKGISKDYSNPMNLQEIKKLGLKKCEDIFNAIKCNHNMVNIMKVKGQDLDIQKEDQVFVSWSYPCQDLSTAGKQKGMEISQADGGTRSGLWHEVVRILEDLKQLGTLPKLLLMENVPAVHFEKHIKTFNLIKKKLEDLGYTNWDNDCMSSEIGYPYPLPQSRNRCFMISILKEDGIDYKYNFPQKQELKLCLNDMVDDVVDEKWYLSEKMIRYIISGNDKWSGNNQESLVNKRIATTINTKEGSRRCDASNFIMDNVGGCQLDLKKVLNFPKNEKYKVIDSYNKKVIDSNIVGTIVCGQNKN